MLRQSVIEASQRDDVRDAVARVYADLQAEIDHRKPICNASGRCCRFDEFGHRLYVTTLELAAFVRAMSASESAAGHGACPFQISGLCSVHSIRPFGCRIFFCDSTAGQWQNERYEWFHAELKRMHDALEVTYFYVEWRWALAELGVEVREAASGSERRLSLPQLPL